MRYPLILLLILLILACSDKLPKGILTKKQITPVLVDIHLAESIFSQRYAVEGMRENFQEDLYLSILKKYKIDQEVFEKSVLYYGKHPELYKPVYDEVLNRLSEMSARSRANDSIQFRVRQAELRAKDSLQNIKMKADSLAKDSTLQKPIKADSISKDTVRPSLIKPVPEPDKNIEIKAK